MASDRQDDVEQFGWPEELPPVMNATATAIMRVVIAASASENLTGEPPERESRNRGGGHGGDERAIAGESGAAVEVALLLRLLKDRARGPRPPAPDAREAQATGPQGGRRAPSGSLS